MPQNLWYKYEVHKRQKSLKIKRYNNYENLRSQKMFGIYLRPNVHGNFSACQE